MAQDDEHQRSRPGTQIVCARVPSAPTVASATASAVVENGAGLSPSVIRVLTKPGRTTSTRTPVPAVASARPCASESRPALAAP